MSSKKHTGRGRVSQRKAAGTSPLLVILSHHDRLVFFIVSILAVVLLYGPCVAGPFVYDDIGQIQQNSALMSLAGMHRYLIEAIPFTAHLRSFSGAFYRPLFWLLLSMERHAWGLSPVGYHLTSFIVHTLDATLIYIGLARVQPSRRLGWAIALIWLILPTNCEAVAWISGQAYPLSFLFILIALNAALSYLWKAKNRYLIVYSAAFIVAFLFNDAGIFIFPISLLIIYSFKQAYRGLRIRLLACSFMVTVVYLIVRAWSGARATNGHLSLSPIGISILKYIYLALFPLHLSIDRSSLTPSASWTPEAILSLIVIVLIVAAAVLLRNRIPMASFGIAWLVITLLPYSGLFPLYQGMAERYLYVSSLGLVLTIAALIDVFSIRARRVVSGVFVVVIVCMAVRLHLRVLSWANPVTLYRSSLAVTPRSSQLWYDLGAAYEKADDFSRAVTAYQRAAALDPSYAQAWSGLGNIDYRIGEFTAAEQRYRQALAINPHLRIALKNLGVVLLQQGHPKEAIPYLQKAARINPLDNDLDDAMGIAFQESGDTTSARSYFLKALSVYPEDTIARKSLNMLSKTN